MDIEFSDQKLIGVIGHSYNKLSGTAQKIAQKNRSTRKTSLSHRTLHQFYLEHSRNLFLYVKACSGFCHRVYRLLRYK